MQEGRLPFDVAGILAGQFPDETADGKSGQCDDTLDEATVPYALSESSQHAPSPREPPSGQRDAAPSEEPPARPLAAPLPPMPSSPSSGPQAEPPAHDEIRSKVDDVVLSALIGDFKGLRRDRDSDPDSPGGGRRNDALDGLLTNYRSARFRSDARRAARGDVSHGMNLRDRADFDRKRAAVGSILRDRFILDSEIGRGGMGVVYKAVDRRRLEAGSEQPYVAMKLLNDDFRSNAHALQVLEAEARKAQSLAHPNVATVYDFDRDRSEIFIVMELLTGEPLTRHLSRSIGQGMSARMIATILRGICSALTYAHQRGVIHSDLKPGNVFVTDDGTVKVIDFGLAAATLAGGFDVSQLGGLTEPYASPEMFENAPRDPRNDVFALGCIAYQLLAGAHPFGMKPSDEAARLGLRPEPISDLDPVAWTTICQALSFDRETRTKAVDDVFLGLFET